MTKTPEELTEEWLNNKLQAGSFWFVEKEDSNPEPMVVDMDGDFNDYEGNYYRPCFSKGKLKVLAPCNYDEYKAMQVELAEHRHYCCCSENEVMRLKLAEMEELLKGCKLSTFKIYNRLRFSDENEITPADLINAVDEIKPMLWGILNSINALGESEEK